MELAAQDEELRAALFRFVDVVPACRSLDDLARHLTGFLAEVDDRPPTIAVAMRMAESKAGRAALGAASAAGVKHMAHRFIVGETPRAAARRARPTSGAAGSRPRSTCSGRPRSPQQRRIAYAARCADALDGLRSRVRRPPARSRCSRPTPSGPIPASTSR